MTTKRDRKDVAEELVPEADALPPRLVFDVRGNRVHEPKQVVPPIPRV
jgi:hypothetical protein